MKPMYNNQPAKCIPFDNRWNNTDLQPSSAGTVKFCVRDAEGGGFNESCPENQTLLGALTTTIRKYVFFSTAPRYLDNFTEHEKFIIEKYSAYLPKLMYKVNIQQRTMISNLKCN